MKNFLVNPLWYYNIARCFWLDFTHLPKSLSVSLFLSFSLSLSISLSLYLSVSRSAGQELDDTTIGFSFYENQA